jgi:outer membrane protein insertion porin family
LWQQNKYVAWRITPLFVTIVATPFIDAKYFDSIQNPITKQQLIPYNIVGSSINFEYNNKQPGYQHSFSFFRLNVEKVGSILNVMKYNKNNAQYLKIETEFKHYIASKRGSNWVNRAYIFAGIPIAQNTLPYIKQQSIGGQSSLRGWRVFELGPGPVLDVSNDNNNLITNNGDIKIELNSELRRPIGKLFSGAMKVEIAPFIDAGNIWRFKDTSNNGVAQFGFDKIAKDIAINTGLGLRLDFSLFLIRFDYGMPIKQPYLSKNNGWIFKQDKTAGWNRKYGTFQVGIAYPF